MKKLIKNDSQIITLHQTELNFGKLVPEILSVTLIKQVGMLQNRPDKALRSAPSNP